MELNELKNSLGLGDSKSIGDSPDDTRGREYDQETLNQTQQGYTNFTRALAGGDVAAALEMIRAWSPIAYQGLVAHLHKAGSPEDVQRHNAALLQQMQNIAQAQEAKALDTATKGYLGQFDKLSHSMNLSPEAKESVFAEVNARVSQDPHLKNELRRGNVRAINNAFKTAVENNRLGADLGDDIHALKGGSKEERAEQRDMWLEQQLTKLRRKAGR
jgi:hypothetical protein